MRTDPSERAVTVVGLGAMGAALARAFLAAGHPTTVWNRTAARADELVSAGARRADDLADAVHPASLVVVCVRDHRTVRALLDPLADRLAGVSVVNLTSSTPEDARSTARWAGEHGALYLDGAIMVPTPLIGGPDAHLLYSGEPDVFAEHEQTLRALGGEAEFLGAEPGRASLHDLGMLDVFFAGMTAFLHASALMTADGVPARDFLPYAERVVSILPAVMAGLARDVDAGQHPGDDDTLDMEQAALAHIVHSSRARGVDPALPELVRDLAARAVAAGHGGDGFSRVVDQLRRPGVAGAGR